MLILGVETSCDETAASVVKDGKEILSNVISTSLSLHAKTGGIIPEVASRQQLKFILPVIEKALSEASLKPNDLDAVAVTYGPGLIGPLLIGVETVKTLAYAFQKQLIGVNHLYGHLYANWLNRDEDIEFPALGLIVSGGHTDLVLIKEHGKIQWLGGTRDDACGEAFDKVGRLIGLPYPAGSKIEELAKKGNPKAFNFPRPLIGSPDFDFSFSGLKSAVSREVQKIEIINEQITADICACVQDAIINVLVKKTLKAAEQFNVKSVLLGGGVAANSKLQSELKSQLLRPFVEGSPLLGILSSQFELFVPTKNLCTDNAAMIAAAAYFNNVQADWKTLTANPQLYFD
jgi:N6-L-threonylcarbamoyladenine synthase